MSEARTPALDRAGIAATYELIRPHVRMTPVVETDGADFGLAAFPIRFKLELLQHAGSFKSRGAFANLLLRDIPAAGVIAASGGNHGAAVAFAAMKLKVPARIFVPSVASPTKIKHSSRRSLVRPAWHSSSSSRRVSSILCWWRWAVAV